MVRPGWMVGHSESEHTSFPFREGDVPSRFVLNKFDLNLPTTGLLLGLGFVFVVVVIAAAVCRVVVLDERVFDGWGCVEGRVSGGYVSRMHVGFSALTFAHIRLIRVLIVFVAVHYDRDVGG